MQQYKEDTSLAKYLFHQGRNFESYDYMGSHFCVKGERKGFVFRVWAPNAVSVSVVGDFNHWNHLAHPMNKETHEGLWELFIEDLDDVSKLNNIYNSKIFVVCQTTFNPQQFELIENEIINICEQNNNNLLIKNTICGAQKAIQKSSIGLANESDLMIVVGGKHSSNTLELFANIKNIKPCIHIENINDVFDELKINNISISHDTKIGITAGASTDKQELINLKNLLENYLNKN